MTNPGIWSSTTSAKPAFMQPPASSVDRLSDYKSTVITPDQLDMLVTSKNHDLKSAVALSGGPDDWLFALISLQTPGGILRRRELWDIANERGAGLSGPPSALLHQLVQADTFDATS